MTKCFACLCSVHTECEKMNCDCDECEYRFLKAELSSQ